tara:strand:+ start:371 stop:583 length:213 start_codon:yes stop_codon:yes gene_type:complete
VVECSIEFNQDWFVGLAKKWSSCCNKGVGMGSSSSTKSGKNPIIICVCIEGDPGKRCANRRGFGQTGSRE